MAPQISSSIVKMVRFQRACGHGEEMIHTLGDTEQAERYESTGCSTCRTPAITFDKGWGRTR